MILITGGAGYIGSHCVAALLEKEIEVLVFDNLSTGHLQIINNLKKIKDFDFVRGDLLSTEALENLFSTHNIDAVIHFAAFSQVGESIINPAKYYENNVCGTLNLLNSMKAHNVNKIVFSSTAAVYGEPQYLPIDEQHPKHPINPYGQTKLIIEKIMDDYDKAYNLKSVRLRYFNAAGADSNGRTGEWHEPETHLIPNILKATSDKSFKIFGTDYETKDGTCVRDYINVEDLVQAHILALEYLNKGGQTECFNLGTGFGYTVKEVFENCQQVAKKEIAIEYTDKRAGDPAKLIADSSKAKNILGWSPIKTLNTSIQSAYQWEQNLQNLLQ